MMETMTPYKAIGLLGTLSVGLLIVGGALGRVAFGPMGGVLGLVVGFLVSGLVLRTYFDRLDTAPTEE